MNELVKLSAFEQALAEAKTIPEIKYLRDQAEIFTQWLRKQRAGLEAQNAGAEMKLNAERKLGQMLSQVKEEQGKRTDLTSSHDVTKLQEAEPDRMQRSRWQREANIPIETFEEYLATAKAKGEEITAAGLLRYYATKVLIPNARRNRPPLPPGVYNVVCADPPWQYSNVGVDGAAEKHYPTLPNEVISYYEDQNGAKIQSKFADNTALFLWATNPFLEDAIEVIENWGFEYKTNIVWVKTELKRPGAGFYIRGRHELLLVCTRGSFVPDMTGKEPVGSVIEAPVQEHSKKPKQAYELIEKLYPRGDSIRYLELFAREKRPGWASWGDEII